jgi:hypothetical protein
MYNVWDCTIQIGYDFFYVFCIRTGLLCTDYAYSRVPGDQGGLFFFTLKKLFLALIFVQIELLQFVAYCSNR